MVGGTTISNDDDILEDLSGFYENLCKSDLELIGRGLNPALPRFYRELKN